MKDKTIMKNQIYREEIYQGSLGNCYFASSILAVPEDPERTNRLFLTKEKNE